MDDDIAARHRIADGTDRPEVALDELGADVAQASAVDGSRTTAAT
ncbi:MAG: hypothetical protein ACJ77W_12350 [Chloroflexota bacterium]